MENLEYLNISHNQIRMIQTMLITNLKNLTHLDLSYNLLSELPFSLTNLPLRELNVSHNLLPTEHSFPNILLIKRNCSLKYDNNFIAKSNGSGLCSRIFIIGDRRSSK